MQVVARYVEDRSVDVRHVAVVTLSWMDEGLLLRAKTKKNVSWHTCSQRSFVQLVSQRFSFGRCR